VAVSDPVGQGFVDSLARPGGNVTGLTFFEFSVIGKMLNTLKQIAPTVSRVALAFNPASLSNPPFLRAIEAAAPTLAVELIEAPTREVGEIEAAIATAARQGGTCCSCPTHSPMRIATSSSAWFLRGYAFAASTAWRIGCR
jgi:putative ABC transport system substrate-binding protein